MTMTLVREPSGRPRSTLHVRVIQDFDAQQGDILQYGIGMQFESITPTGGFQSLEPFRLEVCRARRPRITAIKAEVEEVVVVLRYQMMS